jgi:hypothetical protein
MKERINRSGDENLYQPKIHSDKIRGLYQIKLLTGIPMTVLVDQAISEFLESYGITESRKISENDDRERTDY